MSEAEQSLRPLLDRIAEEYNYKDYDLRIEPISSDCGNFTTVLFVITISSPDKENIELFAKVANVGELFRSKVPVDRVFRVERWFYSDLLAKFTKVQDLHGVLEEGRLFIPKYYASREEKCKETLILENLIAKGYTTYNRFESIDWEYASKAVEELAKLHALSIVVGEEYPEEFQEMIKSKDFSYGMMGMDMETPDEDMEKMWHLSINNAVELVKDENRDRIKTFSDSLTPMYLQSFYKPLRKTVIAHGDFKSTNLMHKRNRDGNLQVVIIDYQTLQASNPILDLTQFIFICSNEEFRTNHYDQLLDHYYFQLCLALRRLEVDPDKVYSKEDYESDLKEMQMFGLCLGLFTLQIIMIDASAAIPVTENEFPQSGILTSPLYGERLNGIVNTYVKWGLI